MGSIEKNSQVRSLPLRLFGWIIGGVSLLSIVEDFDIIKLYGNFEKWIDAYSRFVNYIFGWIDFLWFNISTVESNAIIICIALGSAWGRSNYSHLKALRTKGQMTETEEP